VDGLVAQYADEYDFAEGARPGGPAHARVREQARIELGLRAFLAEGGFGAFTTTFEDLHGLPQLPGLAAQRLMAGGYGFAGEGDWKTAALVRVMKAMASGLPAGTSFMEDYTYHLEPGRELVLGAHMLEVCPSIAATRPRVEVHPLGIGGKADPARLVFDGASGPAVVATVVDMGTRFRLIVNAVDAVPSPHAMPNLPVARVLWEPRPSLRVAAGTWILAGGAHHTGFSLALTPMQMLDWAELVGIEAVLIDEDTSALRFRSELRWSDAAWRVR
jgi:L-arabinose isomerase